MKNRSLLSKVLPSKHDGTDFKNAALGVKECTRGTRESTQTKASGIGHDMATDAAWVLNFVEDASKPTTELSLE
jgi:hypothetical protein